MSTARPRRGFHHGDLRQALIAAALRALARHGTSELSLRALGREIGVTPRAPYRHFPTKDALLAAVAVEGFKAFSAFVARQVDRAGPHPLDRLRSVAESYVRFAVAQPAAFRVMYAPYATVNEHAPDLLRARGDAHRFSMQIIAEGQAAGLLRDGDPMELGLVLWTGMHGLAVLLIEGQLGRHDRPVRAQPVARALSGWLLEGLLPRPGSTSVPRSQRNGARSPRAASGSRQKRRAR